MFNHHSNHFHRYLSRSRELSELYVAVAIQNFTLGLIVIFEPIYIFLYFSRDFPKTFLFFGVMLVAFGILVPFGAKIILKIGVKHTMLLSMPFLFLYYFGLWQIKIFPFAFVAVIFFKIIYMILFWPAFHMHFAHFSDKEKRGQQVSQLNAIASLAAAASPFLGGFLLFNFGYPAIFLVVLCLLLSSIIPLFFSKEVHEHYKDSFEKSFSEIFSKKYLRKILVFAAEGIESVTLGNVWPLYLFVLAISYESLGIITSGGLFLGLIFMMFVGKLADKISRIKIKNIGAIITAVVWPFLIFVRNPVSAFFLHSLHKITRIALYLPYDSLVLDWASRDDANRGRSVILYDMVLNLSRGIFLMVLAAIFAFVPSFMAAFLIAAGSSLVFLIFKTD